MIEEILLKMGLNLSPHDPFLLPGIFSNTYSPDNISILQYQLQVGLYVDDFVFNYSDKTQEAVLKKLPQEHTQVDFMGDGGYFLGTTFTWIKHKDRNISAHLRQSEFTEFIAHKFLVQSANKVTNISLINLSSTCSIMI